MTLFSWYNLTEGKPRDVRDKAGLQMGMKWTRKSSHLKVKLSHGNEDEKVYCDGEAATRVKCGASQKLLGYGAPPPPLPHGNTGVGHV